MGGIFIESNWGSWFYLTANLYLDDSAMSTNDDEFNVMTDGRVLMRTALISFVNIVTIQTIETIVSIMIIVTFMTM